VKLQTLRDEFCKRTSTSCGEGWFSTLSEMLAALLAREGLVVIKPSGVAYETMNPADMVVVDREDKKRRRCSAAFLRSSYAS